MATIVVDNEEQAAVLLEVVNERARQDIKWRPIPRENHDFGRWLQILIEELGEASRADLENQAADRVGWVADTERATDRELTQAAAVIVAWLEHRMALKEQQHFSENQGDSKVGGIE